MPPRSLKLLVAGGFDQAAPGALAQPPGQIVEFAQQIGQQLIAQGHSLINGCQTELDRVVAEAALGQLGQAPVGQRIVSYVMQGKQPIHRIGTLIQSDRTDWDIGGSSPQPPELVGNADAVILLGGFYGTFMAANWARLNHKPLLPFAVFGGAAKEVYAEEAKRFDQIYSGNITRLEYDQVVRSLSNDWPALAKATIALAEKVVTSPRVFVIMSFRPDAQYEDLYDSIRRVCAKFQYEARRVDESNLNKRIVPEIARQIRQCAFVIADVSEAKANVYYEVGFADGLAKETILVARKDTPLPFDINDVPVLFWDGLRKFEQDLERRVANIGSFQGREVV
jgi:predicted Rossmann-fold nucleotide-binding protein